VSVGALLLPMSATGFEAESVHQEHCVHCHARVTGGEGDVLYRGTRGLVRDSKQLRARIDHCQRGASLNWGDVELEAMRAYLNARYYAFPADS